MNFGAQPMRIRAAKTQARCYFRFWGLATHSESFSSYNSCCCFWGLTPPSKKTPRNKLHRASPKDEGPATVKGVRQVLLRLPSPHGTLHGVSRAWGRYGPPGFPFMPSMSYPKNWQEDQPVPAWLLVLRMAGIRSHHFEPTGNHGWLVFLLLNHQKPEFLNGGAKWISQPSTVWGSVSGFLTLGLSPPLLEKPHPSGWYGRVCRNPGNGSPSLSLDGNKS